VTTTTWGLFATLEAVPGREDEVEKLLVDARALVEAEPDTTAWFALRLGHGEYGIFDAFPDEAGRDAHLLGAVVAALQENAELLDGEPNIEEVVILADKRTRGDVTKGLLLRLPIKEAHEDEAAELLRNGEDVVAEEPGTTAWFAIRFENGDYGVFDVFPDKAGRRAHLTGGIPQQLALHGLPWLAGLPHMSFVDVLAQKVDVG
jgi:quinol monooxygenase YgiN